jgi:hypothetical protein
MRVAHALESLLDPFRGGTAGPVSDETIQTTLETCDAIRSLLGRLTHNGAGGPVSPELLGRLGVKTSDASGTRPPDVRDAAFLNTTSQCVEMIAGCFRRMENDSGSTGPVLQTYLRGLKTLSAAAQYANCPELEEPVHSSDERGSRGRWAAKSEPSWPAPFGRLGPFWTAWRQVEMPPTPRCLPKLPGRPNPPRRR